ncbi:MAG TPA: alkaline phosphatase family protein, partial [Polyangiaceae bacterium]|nr:alkaline phosphatase family protein [Polyangiaceae bacterium]
PRFNDWYDAGNHRYYIANDQHPDNNVAEGELLIQEVYQSIRKSKYWEKCVFVIVYDEHGGFFDHVAPPKTDKWGPGARVPTIVISPFANSGVDHTVYDTTAILKLIKQRWTRVTLTARVDEQADLATKALNFTLPQ